ncbi:polymorphic toxin-type HINT domain-containing protein [Saccharothrix variisporea]|uniref:polymorphic toxin-type HINT domain-containing protein n=1 Tax=Saccharothrix variisporea TaxID=543527 RepID=UPI0011C4030D|nr:polymorphic toxin-type HINT domain-containing protein [Saccharothrix variisporea]
MSTGSGLGYLACSNCPNYGSREKTHLILDGLGMLPVIGEPMDALNCQAYAMEGQYVDAAMSCADAIPVLGIGFTLVKWAKNSVRAGEAADAARGAVKCVNSFTGDTLVLMADGTAKSIDQIKVGDKIANSEPESDEAEEHEVLAAHITDADKEYVDVTIETTMGLKVIHATAHHPFFNAATRQWVDAADLSVGDELKKYGVANLGPRVAHLRCQASHLQPDGPWRPHLLCPGGWHCGSSA